MKLWEVTGDWNTRWKNIKPKIDDSVNTSLRSPNIDLGYERTYDGRGCHRLYDIYYVYSQVNEEIKKEFFEYLDTFTSKKLRELFAEEMYCPLVTSKETPAALHTRLACEYVVSRYHSGRLTVDSLELMVVEKTAYIGRALMIIMRDILKNNGDISGVAEIVGTTSPRGLNVEWLFSHYGKREHFERDVLSIMHGVHYSGSFMRMCYEVSKERLVEVIGYLTSLEENEHERLCQIIRYYVMYGGEINSDVMGVLLELLGDRELIYKPYYDTRLAEWIKKMKDNQV